MEVKTANNQPRSEFKTSKIICQAVILEAFQLNLITEVLFCLVGVFLGSYHKMLKYCYFLSTYKS